MKRNTSILIKTAALVLAFMMLLGVGIMSLSFLHGGVKPNDGNFLTPEHAIAAPTAQELLQKKFDAYNTVTEEDGKRVVTIFSEEQIADIRTRRENGEWFWLSSEEMLFLINDTVKLFEEYDMVRIWDMEGNVWLYNNATKIYDVILKRARILNSAFFTVLEKYPTYDYIFCTGIKNPLTEFESYCFDSNLNPWFQTDKYREENILIWSFHDTQDGKFIYTWDFSVLSQFSLWGEEDLWNHRIKVYPFE